ncbi:MAG: anhydro-N-acetylmuramic acid kinase [Anaerolineae bacterium]|nr:anhydro-N-acetylmuramic acid kinase [Anaerolineae bacterium]
MKVVGLMSGTSADGVDAAIVEITGAPPDLTVELLHFTCVPFEPEVRQQIFELFDPATGTVDRICHMNFALGELFAAAALQAIAAAGLEPADISLIGSHGQTIYHAVDVSSPVKSTLQIGEPAVIARRTGITTVADFRVADVAASGQGAPLVSYVDWLLFRHPQRVRAVQNIGGIANVTYLSPTPLPPFPSPLRRGKGGLGAWGVVAFDTGPGNMLIDYAAGRATDGAWRCDRDGALAARGQVDERLLAELMAHPYLQLPPPKTTGREQFGVQFGAEVWERAQALGLRDEDIVATLTAFTAVSIADAYRRFLPRMPDEVILGGGGARNPTLRAMLEERLAPARLLTHEDLGFSSQAKEAMAFAVLAYEAIHGRPGNLPPCTGAARRVVLGKIVPGENYVELMRACSWT